MNKLPLIDKYAARLLMVSFFLPMRWQMAVAIGCCMYFVFRSWFARQFSPSRNYVQALLLGSGFLLYIGAVAFTPSAYIEAALHLCEYRIAYLLMPFVFAIVAPAFQAVIAGELIWFVYGCIASCLMGNASFMYLHYVTDKGAVALSHVQYRMCFEQSTGIHPTYMGMFLSFSMCILLFNHNLAKPVKYLLSGLMLVFLLSLLAKSPLIAMVAIAAHYVWINRRQLHRFKWPFAGLVALVAAAYLLIPFFRQRTGEMLGFAGMGKAGTVADNSVYVRKLIWTTDNQLLHHYWLTGTGPGRLQSVLQQHYFFYSIAHNFSVGYYDPHNQYFSEWLSFGIIGILLLLTVLAIHFLRAIKTNNYLYMYLLVIFTITFFTETVMARQQGLLFYTVFTAFFFYYSERKHTYQSYNKPLSKSPNII